MKWERYIDGCITEPNKIYVCMDKSGALSIRWSRAYRFVPVLKETATSPNTDVRTKIEYRFEFCGKESQDAQIGLFANGGFSKIDKSNGTMFYLPLTDPPYDLFEDEKEKRKERMEIEKREKRAKKLKSDLEKIKEELRKLEGTLEETR